MTNNPILIHIPHSSTFIPKDNRESILLSDYALQRELLLMTDRYIDELFDLLGYNTHINHISRLVMDSERFRSDKDEEMAQVGMGAIYTKTSSGNILRNISA
jgi:N-formylglutamate deformylase